MAEQDNTQEVMTLDAYLDSKAAHMDKAAIADVARGILSGDIDAFVEIEREPPTGQGLVSLLRHAAMPIEYGRAAYWKRKELLDMKLGRDFDSSVLEAIMIRPSAEAPAMPEPTASSHEAAPDVALPGYSDRTKTKSDRQISAILHWVGVKGWNPLQIPDGELGTIQQMCKVGEETAALFTFDTSFENAWKKARKKKLVEMESHASYAHRGR